MATKVSFQNEKTGEVKTVKVGWSWILFFFAGFLGLPLFLRRLPIWGAVMLALWAVYAIAPTFVSDEQSRMSLSLAVSCIIIGLSIFFAIKGNAMTGKNYLENGWRWATPEDQSVVFAKRKWGIAT